MSQSLRRTVTLPSTSSLAYFECVLDAFPDAILNTIVETTKSSSSTFNSYDSEKRDVLCQVIKHSVRAGFQILAASMDNNLVTTIIHVYRPHLEEFYSKIQLSTRFVTEKREIVSETWKRLGFDKFVDNLPIELIHKLCESVGFREELDNKRALELALNEEIVIIGFREIIRRQELKNIQSALVAVRTEFQSLFDQYPFFEDSYCVSDNFDLEAFGLFFLSFSFPHVRKEFIYYIQNCDEILKKLNNRSLKKVQSLSLTNIDQQLFMTSSEKDALQTLVENGHKTTSTSSSSSNGETKEKSSTTTTEKKTSSGKKEKKPATTAAVQPQPQLKQNDKPEQTKTTTSSSQSASSSSTLLKTKPTVEETVESVKQNAPTILLTTELSDDLAVVEETTDHHGADKEELTFPSSEGRVKIEKGVTAIEIYTNYTAKEIYDMCKIFKIKLKGNSTERSRRITKFINEGIVEGSKRKRKRNSSYSSSKKSK